MVEGLNSKLLKIQLLPWCWKKKGETLLDLQSALELPAQLSIEDTC